MTIKSYPLWPFEPNWDTPFVESLQWLTDVLASDDGSEQRRSLRFYPRRGFEFAIMTEGAERSLLDNLLTTFSSATWYLPLWHDVTILSAEAVAGQNEIAVVDGDNSGLVTGKIAVLMDESVFEYELVEIASVGETVTTVEPLTNDWGAGSRIMPVTEARFLEQPSQSKLNDRLTTADVQFEAVEKQIPPDHSAPVETGITAVVDTYGDFAVFPYEPNEDDDFEHTLERNIDTFDPETGITAWRDISGRAFHKQDCVVQLEGREDHVKLANLLQEMRGMALPIWVPTFNQDFVVNSDLESGSTVMSVDLSGFVFAGGPRDDRKHIMIETTTGRMFREIIDADQVGTSETLYLDEPFPDDIPMGSIVRVCFMTLMRLTSDTVEIEHHTDNSGVSDVKMIFRSAPDTRTPEPAF